MKQSSISAPVLRTRLRRAVLVVLLLFAILSSALYALSEKIRLGAEAYLFGYPLVIIDATRTAFTQTLAPENRLHRVRQFPDADFTDVVRPNADTLYTTAFIDMAQGPWVFEMAANNQRYEVMSFMDGWSNVFAAPGTRTTGTGGGRFLLAGPGWQGQVPAGLTLLRAPTNTVWLIGRTQTNGAADYPLVHRLQDGLRLRALRAWQAGQEERDELAAWQPAASRPLPPVVQMQAMDVETFFTRLAVLMVDNPPAAADQAMLEKLARLGVAPGRPPQWGVLERWSVSLGRWMADRKVAGLMKIPTDLVRGWATPPASLGNYGTQYNIRAAVAMVGLGANLPEDAIYPHTRVDGAGQPLHGKHRYRLHFPAGTLPPANAFWSVTAYDLNDFFIENGMRRYAIGDRDPLAFNPDGSLDLYVQAAPPADERKNNWLPVKADQGFVLNARLYWPKPEALHGGAWHMPAVERID